MKLYLNIFKALSDENRLRILLMLKVRPLCVCEIFEVLNIALSTLSSHLKLMKNYGLIEDEKDGRWVIYKLVNGNNFLKSLLGELEKTLQNNERVAGDRIIISQITREICSIKLKERSHEKL